MVKVKNMSNCEFENRLLTDEVVCFCAGYGLRELCEIYPQLSDRISYVVDNYSYGKNIKINSCDIPIIAMEEIQEDIKGTLLLITSLKFADEIIKRLDSMVLCDGLEVFIPALFQIAGCNVKLKKNGQQIIPKKIHYCWFGKGSIPERFQMNIESWKKMCPDYEIIRWDESNYNYKKNKYMRQAYELKKWGFVPDYARLDIIDTYGGIYLDTDIELLKPLDVFLQFHLFCGFEDLWSVNFGLGFGGTSGNRILQEMMILYDEIDFVKPDNTLNLTASPVYQTKILVNNGLIRNGNSQIHEDFAVFSPEFFSPFDAFGLGRVTEHTYSIHQYAATWFGDEQKLTKSKMSSSVKYVMERMTD